MQVIKDAKSLHPSSRLSKNSSKALSRLAVEIYNTLGDSAMKVIFGLKADSTKYTFVDDIKREFAQYQMDDELPGMSYDDNALARARSKRPSYWREAYALLEIDSGILFTNVKRMDEYWVEVSKICDMNGTQNCSSWRLLSACFHMEMLTLREVSVLMQIF